MNLTEYKQVEKLTYRQYCDYLQNKYGIGLKDYMTKSWNKNTRVKEKGKKGQYANTDLLLFLFASVKYKATCT